MKGINKMKECHDGPRNYRMVLQLKGRLGNQMFRYAYLRSVRELRERAGIKDDIVLDVSEFEGKNASGGWENSLQYFQILPYRTVQEKALYRDGKLWQKFLGKTYYALGKAGAKFGRPFQLWLQNLVHPLLSGAGLHFSLDNESFFNPFKDSDLYIDGSFENANFFSNVRKELLEEFTPKEPELSHNEELYKIIREEQSICISVRRGDFVKNKAFKGIYDVCDKDYFMKSLALAARLVEKPVFVFFSDDIEWVRQNLVLDQTEMKDIPVCYERGDDPVWEKLRLMYSCKHFILSNSTFSWWAQYLSANPNKIVISPDRWYRDQRPHFLIEPDFLKINTNE